MRSGENAGNQLFLLYPTIFSTLSTKISIIRPNQSEVVGKQMLTIFDKTWILSTSEGLNSAGQRVKG